MLRRHCPAWAASRQHRLSACRSVPAFLILAATVLAEVCAPAMADTSSNDIVPLNLAAPPQCETVFYTDLSLNNGALPNDLSVVTTSVCGNQSRPFRWNRGSWSQLPMPAVMPGQGAWAESVSDDDSGQPSVTLLVGDDSYWDAWVSTAGRPPVELGSLDDSSHPIEATVSSDGKHIVGEVENDADSMDVRAVRWTRSGEGWSLPEEIAPGFAAAVSADGRVIVGKDPYGSDRPWVWTETASGASLDYLDGQRTIENITDDGQVIVGSRQVRCRSLNCDYPYIFIPVYWIKVDGSWREQELQRPDGIPLDTSVWGSAAARVGDSVIIVGNTNRFWQDGTLHAVAWIPGADGEYGAPISLEPIGGDPESPVAVFDINRQGVAAGWSYELPIDGHPEVTLWQVVNAPNHELNAGHSGAWYDPETPGQGLLIDVVAEDHRVFLSWFTFTDAGEQHWFTAQGNFTESEALLTVYETLGGRFNVPWPTSTSAVGELTLRFSDCRHGVVEYRLESWGVAGEFPIQRLIPGSENVCNEGTDSAVQSIDITTGLDGAWYDPLIPGQGFMIDVHSDPQAGNYAFLAWMTFGDDTESGQRWLTAQGGFEGQAATLDVYETTGGALNDPRPPETRWAGQMTLEFSDCGLGSLSYSLLNIGEDTTALLRLLPRGASCGSPADE